MRHNREAKQERNEAKQERKAKEEAQQERDRALAKLRELGIDPETL
ncbi:hypothetical protein [Limnospira fusiformis]